MTRQDNFGFFSTRRFFIEKTSFDLPGFTITFTVKSDSVKKYVAILLLLFLRATAYPQLYLYDTVFCGNIYQSPELKECLKGSLDISSIAVTIGANALWLIPSSNFTFHDNNALWGLGFAGTGFLISMHPAIELREAKVMLKNCGYDRIPDNSLYRSVANAHAMAVAATLTGVASTCVAAYGVYCRSDVVFGIGLAGSMVSTILSGLVPLLVKDAMNLYDKGAPASVKLGVTENGVGIVCLLK